MVLQVGYTNITYLAGNVVELVLVGIKLASHSLLRSSVENHVIREYAEIKETDEAGVFIGHLSGGYSYLVGGYFKSVNFIKKIS